MKFVEPDITLSGLHSEYCRKAQEAGKRAIGIKLFSQHFHEAKMSVFKPKKDQYCTCIAAEQKSISAEAYQKHREEVGRAKQERAADEARAKVDPAVCVVTMDLQAVMLCPRTQASAMYYRTKLKVSFI